MVSEPPPPPKGLKKPGRTMWERVWNAGKTWLSPQTDYDILERLARAHDEEEMLRARLRKDGHFTVGSTGQIVSHPAVAQLRTLELHMTRWESLCGLNPSDRSRLGLAEVKKVSALESFLSKQNGRTYGSSSATAD
jgi:P27 family predicted phage terminase small subunit